MILVIDSGNTRVKWGVHDGRRLVRVDAAAVADLARSLEGIGAHQQPTHIAASNVAGARAHGAIESAVARFKLPILWARSTASACGVLNGYEDVASLGTDRWMALIGAWHRANRACVVVNCGTATTVDSLNDQGQFTGGLILPSIALMKKALHENTAKLPLANGRHVLPPRRTADAIESGCIEATVGAIERARARLSDASALILTGGAADLIAGVLGGDVERVDHLTLEGLVRVAQQ